MTIQNGLAIKLKLTINLQWVMPGGMTGYIHQGYAYVRYFLSSSPPKQKSFLLFQTRQEMNPAFKLPKEANGCKSTALAQNTPMAKCMHVIDALLRMDRKNGTNVFFLLVFPFLLHVDIVHAALQPKSKPLRAQRARAPRTAATARPRPALTRPLPAVTMGGLMTDEEGRTRPPVPTAVPMGTAGALVTAGALLTGAAALVLPPTEPVLVAVAETMGTSVSVTRGTPVGAGTMATSSVVLVK